jgi:SAM-dependent methyltransferase
VSTREDDLWSEGYKIPWHEPDFSRRMLVEHLSQEHDLASRRVAWIDRQVAWLHANVLGGQAARVLDLGCGPGFYAQRLAGLGHTCHGIDFGPASIEYAREHSPDAERCTYECADLREVVLGGPFDAALFLYGECNVFAPVEIGVLLRKVRASLTPGGVLLCEAHTPAAVEGIGSGAPSEAVYESGLFSDQPHRVRTENRWFAGAGVAVQTFTVTDQATGAVTVYRSTTKAWTDAELAVLFAEAGFDEAGRREEWPCNTEALVLWMALRAREE